MHQNKTILYKYNAQDPCDGRVLSEQNFINDSYEVSKLSHEFSIRNGGFKYKDANGRTGFKFFAIEKRDWKVSRRSYLVSSYSIGLGLW